MAAEKTGKQVPGASVIASLGSIEETTKSSPLSYSAIRIIRKDPTVALGRAFSVAPILNAEWSVEAEEGVPDEQIRFIRKQVNAIRLNFLEHALYGGVDFGWSPFELVFGLDKEKIVLKKLKPLLQDITTILTETNTGAFAGFKQDTLVLPTSQSLLVSFRVEGTLWYGNSLLDNIADTYYRWVDANDGAKRYDLKLAGSMFIVHYPPGNSLDKNDVEKDNATLAQEILAALESSGSIAIPSTILERLAELNKEARDVFEWRIEILEDGGGRQPFFIVRLKYLDTLKIRGMIMPERTMTEGSHGTLAEASAHLDLSLTYMDFLHAYVLAILNEQLVNRLLVLNYGKDAEGSVWVVHSSLVDAKRVYLEKVYITLLSRMSGDAELDTIDRDTLKDLVGVPKSDLITKTGIGEGKSNKTEKEGTENAKEEEGTEND